MLAKKLISSLALGLLLLVAPGLPAAMAGEVTGPATAATAAPASALSPSPGMAFTSGDAVVRVDPQGIDGEALAAAGDNMVRFNGDVVIRPDEIIQGNVVVMNGDIEVRGRVLGNVTAINGSVTLRSGSFVQGNVTVIRGDIVLENGAQVQGHITMGSVARNLTGGHYFPPSAGYYRNEPGFGGRLAGWLLYLLGLIAITAVAMALFPTRITAMQVTLEANPGRCLGVGFLGWIALPVVLLALVLTIIGIPVAIAVALILPLIVLIGLVLTGLVVGQQVERALGRKWPAVGGQTLLVQAAMGVALLWLAQSLPVVGMLIWVLAAVIGMGAVLITRFGTNRPWFGGKPPSGKVIDDQVNGNPGTGEVIDIPPEGRGAMPDPGRENQQQ